jgi:menaquinone-dependent protoporphyrinogen oxidase
MYSDPTENVNRAPHRVLVTYASQGGSTAQIALAIGTVLLEAGCDIDVRPVRHVQRLDGYTAVVVGSAVYHGVWLPEAFKFLQHHRAALSTRPVWLFDSGPLDRSAEHTLLPTPTGVADLARAIGVRGHMTFGGRLGRSGLSLEERLLVLEGKGGDYRNFDDIRAWADLILRGLAAPGDRTNGP